jgi:hypothetical protein
MDKRRIAAMLPAVSARAGQLVSALKPSLPETGRTAARRTRLAAAQRALLPAREPSLRAIPNDSPPAACHARAVGLTRRSR